MENDGAVKGCRVMGIVNVTPDSFSDGGRFVDPEAAIRRAAAMVEDGADIIDIGGESTRPGSTPVSWEEEWSRVEPVLRGLSPIVAGSVPISIDTYHPETAERAVSLGATIVNCVYPEPILDMLQICAKNGAELVIPAKSLGSVPKDLGSVPIYLDPMIGFGTTREEDLALLRSDRARACRGGIHGDSSRRRHRNRDLVRGEWRERRQGARRQGGRPGFAGISENMIYYASRNPGAWREVRLS